LVKAQNIEPAKTTKPVMINANMRVVPQPLLPFANASSDSTW
jgi:hypothetical protein